jgi:hypothetical protein
MYASVYNALTYVNLVAKRLENLKDFLRKKRGNRIYKYVNKEPCNGTVK